MKEKERNERIIRSLLKLSPNPNCINCNSLVVLETEFCNSLSLEDYLHDAAKGVKVSEQAVNGDFAVKQKWHDYLLLL
ncbi:hypothetical protein Syun_018499 [Stephania yunnanensis]|uniref:Uncharacterized protein n=1 Tax=Stephania yunnanensis TaxID=152371 RepID=A0AAP0ISC4_9MAGN